MKEVRDKVIEIMLEFAAMELMDAANISEDMDINDVADETWSFLYNYFKPEED